MQEKSTQAAQPPDQEKLSKNPCFSTLKCEKSHTESKLEVKNSLLPNLVASCWLYQ